MGRRLAFWVLLALSCAQLDGVDPNLCGNQVHDADEDCDDAHVPGSTCLPAGVVGECRYGCDAELSCPAGFVCGDADGICRRPSGAFTAIRTYPAIGARDVALTNFDGDDTAEVTLIELDRLRIHYADEAGQVIDTHVEVLNPRPLLEEDATFGNPLPDQIPDVFPLLRDFSGDGIDDAVLAFEPGLSVVLGRGDRTLVPLAFPSFGFPAIVQDAAATGLDLRPARAGDELFAIVEAFNVSVIIALDDDTAELINTAAKKPSEVILPMASGNVMAWQGDPPMPHVCEEAVFAYQGEDEVLVYAAAQPDPDSPFPDECKYVPTTPRRIEMPTGGVVVRAPKVLE